MKLIKCHIENFGKLANFDYDFVGGLNCIKAENGWGKTTFATFIKAMFYGLPATTKKDLDANERKKYTPWQGGNYGGNLIFVINQRQYKIERFFGKNKTEDTCTIIDLNTGKKSKTFSENIGTEIFGLDEEAFERSAYIPQKVLATNINASMTQKLTDLIQGATENYNYEQAQKRLDAKRVQLSNHQKTGQMQNLATQIEDVMTQMRELLARGQMQNELQKQITMQTNEIDTLTEEQNQIKHQINQYGHLQEKRAHQAFFAELNRKVLATQAEIKNKQDVLNHHQTSVTEVESYIRADQAISARENEIKIKTSNDYVQQRYQTLTDYFRGKVPTVEATQAAYQEILQYNARKNQITTAGGCQGQVHHRQRQAWCLGLALLAVVCILGGVFALKSQWILAVSLFVVAGLLLLVAVYLSLVHMINVKTSVPQILNSAPLQKHILTFLSQYETTDDYLTAINHISANLQEYIKIKEQMTLNTGTVDTLRQTLAAERSKLDQFLSQFKFTEPNQSRADYLAILKQTLLDLAQLNRRLAVETEEFEQFKAAKHFDVTDHTGAEVDINMLQQKERALQTRIDAVRDVKAKTIAQIHQINDDLATLDELENQKVGLQNELQTLESEFNALKSAMKFLQTANESLSTKFLAPMKNGLRKYLTLVTNREFDNLNLDTDLQIAFEEFGKIREIDYYSQGYRNTIDLCLRLALIDVLYPQEKPFIVLDDPFVNLDDAKIARAKHFLPELAKNYQLIYFSCHQSRC